MMGNIEITEPRNSNLKINTFGKSIRRVSLSSLNVDECNTICILRHSLSLFPLFDFLSECEFW